MDKFIDEFRFDAYDDSTVIERKSSDLRLIYIIITF